MNERKLVHIQTKIIKANGWTEEAGYKAVSSWLRLSTSQVQHIDLVAAQNDWIAVGARKAFGEILNETDHNRWLNLPFTGANGLPKTGQAWVRGGLLAATVIDPPSAGLALETMVNAIRGGPQPPECILTQPKSFPSIEELKRRA
jgi:ribose transport system substrate-binding protein